MQVPNGTGPGVRRSKRPLLASRTRCKNQRRNMTLFQHWNMTWKQRWNRTLKQRWNMTLFQRLNRTLFQKSDVSTLKSDDVSTLTSEVPTLKYEAVSKLKSKVVSTFCLKQVKLQSLTFNLVLFYICAKWKTTERVVANPSDRTFALATASH